MNSYQNNMFRNNNSFGDPNEPKCCFIFPFSWGIVFISIMILMDGLKQYTMISNMFPISHLIFAIEVVAVLPILLALFIFILYFIKDTKQSRSNLVLACSLMILANIVAYAGIIIGALVVDEIPVSAIMSLLPVNGLGALIYFYFRYICIEWE